MFKNNSTAHHYSPDWMLMNGKVPYSNVSTKAHESFTVTKGTETYSYTRLMELLLIQWVSPRFDSFFFLFFVTL